MSQQQKKTALARAVRQAITEQNMTPAQVARRLADSHDRATFYRILSGATPEPRLDTLIQLCAAIELSPTELLQQAGLWAYQERATDALDQELRDCFSRLHALPLADRRQTVRLVSSLVTALRESSEQRENAAARRRPA